MKELYFGTGASSCKIYEDLHQVLEAAIAGGIMRFDTAPSYGTEEALGKALHELSQEYGVRRDELCVQTKIDPWQMQEKNGNVREYIELALGKLRLDYLDALLIHWPVPEYFDNTWDAFIQLRNAGLVKKIGVCNVRVRQLSRMQGRTELPQIVQIERNPLRTCEEELRFCRDYHIEVQAYSPLCKMDDRIKCSKTLQDIAEQTGKNIGQVVLRWHIDTGVHPIFTSKKCSRIHEYCELDDFSLTPEQISQISVLNENYKMYLESCICPGF